MSVGASCMHRRLRVCRLLPPRNSCGAHSSTSTRAPARAATIAEHNAAFPPPAIRTSLIDEERRFAPDLSVDRDIDGIDALRRNQKAAEVGRESLTEAQARNVV